MNVSLLHRLAGDPALSPAGRTLCRSWIEGHQGYEPLNTLHGMIVEETWGHPDLTVIALATVAEYRRPDAQPIYLDPILQSALAFLQDMDIAPTELVQAAVDVLATETHGSKAYLLWQFLDKVGRKNPECRALVVANLTQANYSALTRASQRPPACRPAITDLTTWEYQGWLDFARDWHLADLFFELASEAELNALLSEPLAGVPEPELIQYFLLHRLWLGDISLSTLLEIGRLARRTKGDPQFAALHDRAVLVFHRQWGNVVPHGLMDAQPAEEPARTEPAEPVSKIDQILLQIAGGPSDPGLWHELADLYREDGQWSESIEADTMAIERHQNFAAAYYGRAKSKMALKDYPGAREDFTFVIRICQFPYGIERFLTLERPPEILIDGYRTRGVASAHLGDFDAALADVSTAIRLNRDNARLIYERAYLAEKSDRPKTATEDYRRAARLFFDQGSGADADRCIDALVRLGATSDANAVRAWIDAKTPSADLPL